MMSRYQVKRSESGQFFVRDQSVGAVVSRLFDNRNHAKHYRRLLVASESLTQLQRRACA